MLLSITHQTLMILTCLTLLGDSTSQQLPPSNEEQGTVEDPLFFIEEIIIENQSRHDVESNPLKDVLDSSHCGENKGSEGKQLDRLAHEDWSTWFLQIQSTRRENIF